jgi:hypothetical protein
MSIKGLFLVLSASAAILAAWLGHYSWIFLAEAAAKFVAAGLLLAGSR